MSAGQSGAARPSASSTRPAIRAKLPATGRRATTGLESRASSRRASTGVIRRAFSAGESAASTVMPTPTAMATPTVRPVSSSGSMGSSPPRAPKMAFSAADTPIPPARPSPVAMRPTVAASPSTERRIWIPVAPTTRSRPNSRMRWPMTIENTLFTRNADTTSVMTANASRMFWKIVMNVSNSALCSSATSSTVSTSSPGGNACLSEPATAAMSASRSTSTRISSQPPPPFSSSVAVARSNTANCTPCDWSSSGSAQFTVPTSSKARVPSGRLTRYVSPIRRSANSAVRELVANSVGPAGCRPSSRNSSVRFSSSDQLTPSWGGPNDSSGSPSGSMMTTFQAATPPVTAATPSTPSITSARAGSTSGAFSRSPNSSSLRTLRSIDPAMSSAMSSKVARRLSVTMKTPTTKETPSTTLSAVPRKRNFLLAMFLRVSRSRNMAMFRRWGATWRRLAGAGPGIQAPSVLTLSSTPSTVGSRISSTIRPSLRNTIRSL